MKNIFVFTKSKMAVKVLSLLLVVFFMVVLGSCVSITPTLLLPAEDELIEGSGYIYGSFGFDLPELGSRGANSQSMGIVIQNLDTLEKYSFFLRMYYPDRLQVTAVPPGNYRLDSIEYFLPSLTVQDLDITSYERNFVVEQDTAIYLGDFWGTLVVTTSFSTIYYSSSLETPVNNYDETTAAIKEKYPLLTEPPITFVSNMKDPQISDTEEPSASDN